ncbi:MAG TPA: hypothetical protein VEJ37_02265 [Xanthobacteraceae bacterium]|nr:hypothetical protein [Xanthobacteraceae bacterium]
MVIVEEFGQLLAQAFVALAPVAKYDGALEQGLLKFLRQMTPKFRGGRAEDEKVTVRLVVVGGAFQYPSHENLDAQSML